MDISPGTRLGPYEIVAHLGAGGMGTVYRARDTRLSRDVALKLLPEWASSDSRMRERLSREAHAISALSHPNICRLFDVGSTDGVDYLVMELLDGESLADRLARGPLSSGEALRIAGEIALALDAAHRAGIAHRDLKPANVMLTRNGARLLDFGLAKVFLASEDTNAQTLTREGALLGTLRYMAPEQVEGRSVDARTDVFAFGLVLYEMLAGRPAFRADSRATIITAILTSEPPPISNSNPNVPAAVERLVRRCLKKNPDERWQSMQTVAEALHWAGDGGEVFVEAAPERRRWLAPAVIVVLLALLGFSLFRGRAAQAPSRTLRFSVNPPPGTTFAQNPTSTELSLSPDGNMLAYIARDGQTPKLFVRSFDELTARPIEGTDGATSAFWSPDAKWIAFFSPGFLKKVPSGGGPVQTICAGQGGHGSWSRRGDILYFTWGIATLEGVGMVRDSGGATREVTAGKLGWGMWPSFLSDDRHFIFYRLSDSDPNQTGICLGSIDNPAEERLLLRAASRGEVRDDDLYYVRDGVLLRQHFDAKRLAVDGEPVAVAEGVFNLAATAAANFSVSDDARTIVWQRSALPTQLVWRDLTGRELGKVGGPDLYRNFSISPDERRVVVDLFDRKTQTPDIWIVDAERGVKTRITPGDRFAAAPTWLHRADTVVISLRDPQHSSAAPDLAALTLTDGATRTLARQQGVKYATSVTADDRNVIYSINRGQWWQIEMMPLAGGEPVLVSGGGKHDEREGRLSPDQRWLVFESDESGRREVYIRPFGRAGEKVRVSAAGGVEPQWAADGSAVFFMNPDGNLIKADVDSRDQVRVTRSTLLFHISSAGMMEFESIGHRHFAIAHNNRILVRELLSGEDADPVTVLLNGR